MSKKNRERMKAGSRTRVMTCPVCGGSVTANERVAGNAHKIRATDFVIPPHGPGPAPDFEESCPASNKTTRAAQAINNLGCQKKY